MKPTRSRICFEPIEELRILLAHLRGPPSICVEALLNAGHTVTVYDNLSEGHRSAVDPRAKFIQNCLSDAASVKEVLQNQPEAVVHFSANALVGEYMTNPGKYFRNNVASGLTSARCRRRVWCEEICV